MTRQIAAHDGDLMEVTHLDWVARRQGYLDARSAITDHGLDGPTGLFKVVNPAKIIGNRLPADGEPVDIPVEIGGAEEHDPMADTKKEPIDNQDDWARNECCWLGSIRRKLFSDPGNTFARCLTQLPEILFVPDILLPELLGLASFGPSLILELCAALVTAPALPAAMVTNLPGCMRCTGWTLFF